MKKHVRVGLVGTGWVGGILLRWLTENGWRRGEDLFCFDADPAKNMSDDLTSAKIVFICVPTPSHQDGSCDTSIVEAVVQKFAGSDKLLVIRSTVSPGTADRLSKKYNVAIAFNPEFLTEKNAWNDFIAPTRQIVGATELVTKEQVRLLFQVLPADCEQMLMTATEAELVKYFSNAFGALKVTFANVVGVCAEGFGADHENVLRGVAADHRIGPSWMDIDHGAYRGFGGYCFPKDMRGLIAAGEELIAKFSEHDRQMRWMLTQAIAFLRAAYQFNQSLLSFQGLRVEDVDGHIDEERMKAIKSRKKK